MGLKSGRALTALWILLTDRLHTSSKSRQTVQLITDRTRSHEPLFLVHNSTAMAETCQRSRGCGLALAVTAKEMELRQEAWEALGQ
ncbi:hypothetical protein BJ166DRAFT_537634 [Pestalotiopsis sp. NC0098]|nr:hypothetical protein BJ166DRAFT_537634 [Pestalotiopsis sp. NC0098]